MTAPDLDRIELRALVDRYALAVDRRRPAEFTALFAPDGVLVNHRRGGAVRSELRGPGRLLQVFEELKGIPATFHLVAGQVAEIAGDRRSATAVVHAVAHHRIAPGTDAVWVLHYRDSYLRTAGGWRFTRREVRPQWYENRAITNQNPQNPQGESR
jgi:hypothetical protein